MFRKILAALARVGERPSYEQPAENASQRREAEERRMAQERAAVAQEQARKRMRRELEGEEVTVAIPEEGVDRKDEMSEAA
jgi:hypothetical protein